MNKNLFQTTLYPLVLTVFLILASSTARATDVSGTLSSDTNWTLSGSPYTVVNTVTVADGATLTIEPGVEVIMNHYEALVVNGELVAEGTSADPILIKGSSPSAGWWNTIYVGSSGSATFAYCTISDAGYSGNYSAIYKTGTGSLSLRHCTLSNSSGAGLRLASGSSSFISEYNTFSNNRQGVRLETNTSFSDTTSTFSNNLDAQVTVDGGTHTTDVTWRLNPAYAVTIASTQVVSETATLTIDPGTVVKFYQYAFIYIDGQLIAEATSGSPIYFTSQRDDTVGGDSNNNADADQPWVGWWGCLNVRNSGSATLNYCTVAWSGYTGDSAGIKKTGSGSLSARNCTFRNIGGAGIRLNEGYSSFLSQNNHFENNSQGIRLGINTSFTDTTSTFGPNAIGQVTADGGTHTTDVSWELSSAYSIVVTSTQYVAEGVTLTVEPGTVVKFNQYAFMYVDGQLLAEGSSGSPIYFTSHRDDTVGGDSNNNADADQPWQGWWGCLNIRNSGSATLNYCTIAWAGYSGDSAGVMKTGTGSLSARNCTFRNIGGAGVRLTEGSASFLSQDNHFENNSQGIRLGTNTSFTDTTSTFGPNAIGQVTADGGTHTVDVSWELSSAYSIVVTSSQYVAEGVTLTVEPGTVVKFYQYAFLYVDGQLIADGTLDKPIYFTSHRDDTIGGDSNNNGNDTQPTAGWWGCLSFRNAGAGSLAYCTIAYPGYSGEYSGVYKTGTGDLSIRHCTFNMSSGAGLRVAETTGALLSEYNHFNNNRTGVRLGVSTSFSDTTSTFENNETGQVTADGGTLSADVIWELTNAYSIVVTGHLTVPEGVTFTLMPGIVVKFYQYKGISIEGVLIAEGTPGSPISFTSHRDDSIGGDSNNNGDATAPFHGWWKNIRVANAGSAYMHHCNIAYPGYTGDYTGIFKTGMGELSLQNCTFSNSSGSGLRFYNSNGSAKIERCRFYSNTTGVMVEGTTEPIVLQACHYSDNTQYGVRNINSIEVDARSNWWGDASGPYHPTLNPTGSGDTVSDGVLFDPWRTNESMISILSPMRSGTIVAGDTLRFLGSQIFDPGAGYEWSFGNGRSSNVRNPGLVGFPNTGSLQVTYASVIDGFVDPLPEKRSYSVVTNSGNYPDLKIQSLTVPSSIGIGQASTLQYSVTNSGPGSLSASTWTDRVYLSLDDMLDASDLQLASATISRSLAPGASYQGSIPMTLPPVAEGALHLILSVNDEWKIVELHRLNNETSRQVSVLVPRLQDGLPQQVDFVAGQVKHYYKITVTASENLRLDFINSNPGLEACVRFGELPTRSVYDHKVENGTLVIPSARPGDWFVLVYGALVPQAGSYKLQFDMENLIISAATPAQQDSATELELTVSGAGFSSPLSVSLIAANGTPYSASSVSINSYTSLTATFTAGMLPPGSYDVRVNHSGDFATLPDAVQMISGGQPDLYVDIISPQQMGYHQLATLYVEYGNRGNAPMPAPLLIVTAVLDGDRGALFTLDQSLLSKGFWTSAIPKGFASSVRLLGGGAEPGILQPGEHMRVPVYYAGWLKPWDFSYPPFEFDVRAFTANDTHPMDWAYLKDTLKTSDVPADAWDGIWQNFTSAIGNTSGDFVRMLSANANYLQRIGADVSDVHDLLAFELIKAKGLIGPFSELTSAVDLAPYSNALNIWFVRSFPRNISQRYRLGPMGYGWNHIWEIHLTHESDGTKTVLHGNGATRVFQPDSRGSAYFSSKGDPARLVATFGNTYTLTEPDGTAFVFNAEGTLLRTQHRNGETVQLQYSGGRLTGMAHSNGLSLTLRYNASGLIDQARDSLGNTVTYSYDTNKHLVSVTDPQGRTLQYTYSSSNDSRKKHALTGILIPGNIQQTFTYDTQGRLDGSENGLGSTSYTYHQGELTATDANDHSITISFDNYGVLCRVVDPEGGVTSLGHDAELNNTTLRSPDGSSVISKYGQDGSIKEIIHQNGATWSFQNGSHGQLSRITSPTGRSTAMQYDSKGNLVRLTYPDGNYSTFGYDSSGRLNHQVNPAGTSESVTYNAAGLPLSMNYSDGSSRTFTYSAKNQILTATNSKGTTRFEYDNKDNLAKVTYPNNLYIEYTYDAAGRPISSTDHKGQVSRYTYNAAGLLYQLLDAGSNELVRYTYDGVGRVSEKYFSTGARTTYERNGSGQITRQTTYNPQGSELADFSVSYDVNGLPKTYTTDQGQFVYTHDISGNIQQVDFHPLAGPVETTRYSRNTEGMLTSITVNGVPSSATSNPLGLYTQVGDNSMSYDTMGNITAKTVNGVSSSYEYNAIGRLTEMNTQGGTYQMSYDALGTPLELKTPDRSLMYLYGQKYLPHLFGEFTTSGEPVRTYQYGLEMAVVHYQGASYFPEYDPIKGETVLSMSAASSAKQLKALASPMLYLPLLPPYQFADPNIPGPVYFGTAMEGYMTLARDAYKTGNAVSEWAVNAGGMDRTVGTLSRNWYYGFGVGVAAIPNAVNTVNDALKAFGPFHFVVEGGGTWGRKGLDFFAKSPSLARGLGFLGVVVGGVEAIDGIAETWGKNKSVDVGDVLNFWSGSTSGPNKKIRHGMASATLAGIGLALVSAPALTIAAPVAAVAAVVALISDNTEGLQESFWIWWDDLDVTGETIRGSQMSGSGDPNQKLGVNGYGEENYVPASTTLTYRIDFENRPEATAPAQVVIIRDQLPDEVDWESFQILELGFGDISIPVEPGTRFFETVIDYAYQDSEYTFDIDVHVEVSIEEGALFAIFYAIDAETGLPPTVDIGFLPPEPEKVPDTVQPGEGRGQGHITYSVSPRQDLPSGTAIRNVATIQFDFSLDIDTNQIDPMDPSKGTDPDKEALVTIDSDIPQASVEALPGISPARFLVNWGGESASGIRSYDVYFRANTGAWHPWLMGTAQTSAIFVGDPYSIYDFYAVGINNVGTVAPYSPVIQAYTTAGVDSVDIMIERTPNKKVKLFWTGYSGFGYQIQTSTDQASWFNVGPVHQAQADGEGLSFTDNTYDFSSNKFYRIIVSLQ